MGKNHLTLYIDDDLKELAKSTNINLSSEFEQWIKIRMNQFDKDKENALINTDLEIAKHEAEIQRLRKLAEFKEDREQKNKEELMVVDSMIDSIIKIDMSMDINAGKKLLELIDETKIHGIQFLFSKKFNKQLNPLEAKEILENRIKERGL